MRTAIAVVLYALSVAQVDAAPRVMNTSARVRSLEEPGRRLLAEGMAKSPTVRALVHRLEQSDVIVYVEVRPDLPAGIGGTTAFAAATPTDRLLRIRLNRFHNQATLISLLGHELRHAVEVAEAPAVRSPESFQTHYRDLGVTLGGGRLDSRAAQQAGRDVRAELLRGGDGGIRERGNERSPVPPCPVPP